MEKRRMRRDLLYFIAIVLMFALGLGSMSFALAAEGELSSVDGVEICLTDGVTDAPLASATLSVHKRGSDEKYVLQTDASGRCVTHPLVPGNTYDIVETEAPEGYIPPLQGWSIIVGEDGSISAKGKDIRQVEGEDAFVLNIMNTSFGDGSELTRTVSEDEIPLAPPVVIGSRIDNTFMMVLGTCMMLAACVWLSVILVKRRQSKKEFNA